VGKGVKRKGAKQGRGKAKTPPSKARPVPAKLTDQTYELVARSRRQSLVPVDQPVALISQAPRSGGTLLRNLFDGHSQCHVHPYEWHFGHTRRHEWPKLRRGGPPELWWSRLVEEPLNRRFARGVRHTPTKGAHEKESRAAGLHPFLLPPRLHRDLFLDLVSSGEPPRGDREILNAYLTALFNAWLNNHTLDDAEKRWVVAFAPRLAWGATRGRFFAAYPDGHLIAILRGPASWIVSARGRQSEGSYDHEPLIAMWKRGAEEMQAAKEERGDRVTIVRFDDLVLEAEGVMRLLAAKLGIDYEDILVEPTFNSRPIGPNSSYQSRAKSGIITAPVTRHKEVLSPSEQELIERECGALYEETLTFAERPAGARELQGASA
jgi:hypothetical protein